MFLCAFLKKSTFDKNKTLSKTHFLNQGVSTAR